MVGKKFGFVRLIIANEGLESAKGLGMVTALVGNPDALDF